MTKDEEKQLLTEVYSTRMLLFLETGPQTNKYRQMILTGPEFQKIVHSIGEWKDKEGNTKETLLQLSERIFPLPDLQPYTGATITNLRMNENL